MSHKNYIQSLIPRCAPFPEDVPNRVASRTNRFTSMLIQEAHVNWIVGYALVALVPWMLWLLPRWLLHKQGHLCVITGVLYVILLTMLTSLTQKSSHPFEHLLAAVGMITLAALAGYVQYRTNNWYARQQRALTGHF